MKRFFLGVLCMSYIFCIAQQQESLCDRHYEAAVKFIVDTPVIHSFTVSYDANTGRKGCVIFSSGNLQYCANYQRIVDDGHRVQKMHDVWRFAPEQYMRCTNGSDVYPACGNVWWDSVVRYTPGSVDGRDSFYYIRRKSTSCVSSYTGTRPNIDYGGWVDLFPWGSSGKGKYARDPSAQFFYPWQSNSTSTGMATNTYGYGPAYYNNGSGAPVGWYDATTHLNRSNIDTNSGLSRYFDWGYANIIREYHHSDSTIYRPGVWRTLTSNEWSYLLGTRKVCGSPNAWTLCSIEDSTLTNTTANRRYIPGLLLYPDDFSFAALGITRKPFANINNNTKQGSNGDAPATYRMSIDEWRMLEREGCVFLPGGLETYPCVTTLFGADYIFFCRYASATTTTEHTTMAVRFEVASFGGAVYNYTESAFERYGGFSVRLVQDI